MPTARIRLLFLLLAFAALGAAALAPQVGVVLAFPEEVRVLPGGEVELDFGPLFSLVPVPDSQVELRLFGWVPLQRAEVRVVDRVEVIPGGQAIGILLSARGVVVVRTVDVTTVTGERISPAARAGIRPGDVLLRVHETEIEHPLELEAMANAYGRRGEAMPVVVYRDGREIRLEIEPVPVFDPTGRGEPRYALGLYLRDPAAGVGTLTFWHPATGAYGALGHVITADQHSIPLSEGRIVPAHIHGVHPGMRGRPGEKLGIFQSGSSLGTIEKNTMFGIFGRLTRPPTPAHPPVPVALAHEVREGDAEILTVLQGERVERFGIRITAVNRHSVHNGRGLVIEVTDPRLLERTNGIVQGMSGSPILQDGKLVGAVTHVFINNPHRGFGVLAEWMVYEAGIIPGPAEPEGAQRKAS